MSGRIYLSPPDVRGDERALLLDAFDSNWIAPLGPHVDAFERESAQLCGRLGGAATNSGTAALHLALRLVGVGPGSDVLMPTLTFVATANSVAYLGARPCFLDIDEGSWTIDVGLLAEELAERASAGRLPSAVVAVDIYGQCADYDALTDLCASYEVPLVIDAAESLGASYRGRAAGSAGVLSILSFNGNKIVTCGGGGMLLADDEGVLAQARSLAAQAREPGDGYLHSELGYNYRLSNLLAAVGRGQLARLSERVAARRSIRARYAAALDPLPGVALMPSHPRGRPTAWLTCITLDPQLAGCDPSQLVKTLAAQDIEARPAWRPLHQQVLYADHPARLTGVAERIGVQGVALPSGSGLTEDDLHRVLDVLVPLLSG